MLLFRNFLDFLGAGLALLVFSGKLEGLSVLWRGPQMAKISIVIDSELKDLIPQFLENRKKDLVSLDLQVQANDSLAISQLAHKIKGSSASYGFAELSKMAAELEVAAKGSDMDSIRRIFPTMKNHLDNIEVVYQDQ